jgi:hypothetical protein
MDHMRRIITVTKYASPHPMAISLIRVLSIRILFEYSDEALRSSEVTSSIIAVTANQRLMSD